MARQCRHRARPAVCTLPALGGTEARTRGLTMPPAADFIHRYRVPPNTIEAQCRIRVYQLADGMIVVIATELPGNVGASITNAAEILATEMRRLFVVPGAGLLWIEHYRDRAVIDGKAQQKESFDRVF